MKQIEDIAKNLALGYVWGTYKEAEYAFDRKKREEFPCVCELFALKGSFEWKYESVKDSQEITLLFVEVDPSKTHNSPETSAIIDRMKSKALEYITALNQTGEFETIDETTLQYYGIVKQFAKCLTGIEITLNLKPTKAVCL